MIFLLLRVYEAITSGTPPPPTPQPKRRTKGLTRDTRKEIMIFLLLRVYVTINSGTIPPPPPTQPPGLHRSLSHLVNAWGLLHKMLCLRVIVNLRRHFRRKFYVSCSSLDVTGCPVYVRCELYV